MTDHAASATDSSKSLIPSLVLIALVVAAAGSLGAPLITGVAETTHVSLASAQWTLTITLLTGAIATPVLGRLGAGPHRRGTILTTLAVVSAGSIVTVLPLPFAYLLIGRAAQGVGLGLTALMMGVARDHLPGAKSSSTIALLSVASAVGIGVGYPLAGLLYDLGGLRVAYSLGVLATAVAFLAAFKSIPRSPSERSASLDLVGAGLLAAALLIILLLIGETRLWAEHLVITAAIAVLAALLVGIWILVERRTENPLVDVRLFLQPAVAGANSAMLIGGVGMYLLLTLITRFAQTPRSTGYGFGLTTLVAGMVLVPFSILGYVAGRVTPRLRTHVGAPLVLAGNAGIVLIALVFFAAARTTLLDLLIAMAILGFGVGGFSSAMPAVVLAVTPTNETSSAMSVNQVVRSVGFSLGSAIGGLVLARAGSAGFPDNGSYTTAAWIGVVVMIVTIAICVVLQRITR